MIAIPNMEKPKNCYQCSFNDGIFCALIDSDTDAFIKDNPTEVATKVLPDCPIIEIDQEDEEAVLFLARMRKAMREEGKSFREFLDGERRSDEGINE